FYPGATLDVQGAVSLINDGRITFGGSGKSHLSHGSATAPLLYDVPAGMSLTVTPSGSNAFDYTVVNQAANPMKDIVMTFNSFVAVVDAVDSHVSDHFLLPVTDAPRSRRSKWAHSAWLKGFGATAEYKTTATQIGHTNRTYGMIAGMDGMIAGKFLLGGYAGFASNKLDTRNSTSITADQQLGGIYSAWRYKKFYMNADITGGMLRPNATRTEIAGQTTGAYKTHYYGGGAGIGLIFNAWKGAQIKPAVSVRHMKAKMPGFAEHGASAMRLPDLSDALTQGFLNMQVSQKFTILHGKPSMVDVMVGWKRNLQTPRENMEAAFVSDPSTTVTLEGGAYDKDIAVAGLAFSVAIRRNIILGLGCEWEIADAISVSKSSVIPPSFDTTSTRTRFNAHFTVRYLW
ncbi:MAG: autotransporter outer membrane beta-barrel domain-containing protein, partial [Opitutaceae bacterium]|nr:autotransporter outer membrane beta-barrel domain-containing protein [Opitutaceae bacterium]